MLSRPVHYSTLYPVLLLLTEFELTRHFYYGVFTGTFTIMIVSIGARFLCTSSVQI